MLCVRQYYNLAFYYQVLVRKVLLDLHHHILVQFHSELVSITSALSDTYWYYTEIFEVLVVVYRQHVITS